MNANDFAVRSRLVKEKAKLLADGEAAATKLSATAAQARFDADRAREAAAKAERAAAAAANELRLAGLNVERAVSSIDAALEASAPLAIDALIAEIHLTRDRFRNSGTLGGTPAEVAHSKARAQGFIDAERELVALKLEALTDEQFEKRIAAIRDRVNASLHFAAAA